MKKSRQQMLCGGRASREGKREVRRQAMLAAAHHLFVEKGYEATTLSDVVGRSGGSLATLYEMFENKPGLLRALVEERCTVMNEAIDRAISSHQPPREALTEIAARMFDKILDPQSTALFKAALAQPELGRLLYEAGPATGQAKVAEYLALQAEEFGHYHHKLLFGIPVELRAEEREEHFDRVMAAFFKIYEYVDARSCTPTKASSHHSRRRAESEDD
jgi:AcrR family transcriptional regulator